MAWNTPGKGSGSPKSNGNPVEDLLNRVKDGFNGRGGSSGPGPMPIVLGLLGVFVLYSCFNLIDERQRGVVLRFGAFDRIMEPGANLKLPWPIESVSIVEATEITPVTGEMAVLTRDQNIVQISYNVQYQISDAKQYLFGAAEPRDLLQQAAESAIREALGKSELDDILKSRTTMSAAALKQLQLSLQKYKTGLYVTQLGLPNARPPLEVKEAFDDVTRAQQNNEAKQNDARAYRNQILPEAGGQAAKIKAQAEGYRAERIARAQGDAKRFTLLLEQYRKAPEVTRKRLYLETMQEVLSTNQKVLSGRNNNILYLPLNGSSPAPAASNATVQIPTTQVIESARRSGDAANTTSGRDARSDRGETGGNR